MYRSSPFRSTLNTGYITGLDMCALCTEPLKTQKSARKHTARYQRASENKDRTPTAGSLDMHHVEMKKLHVPTKMRQYIFQQPPLEFDV